MSETLDEAAKPLTNEEKAFLEDLGLSQISIRNDDGELQVWEPQSLEDARYYLDREIAEIENILFGSFTRQREIIARSTGVKVEAVTGLDVWKTFPTVPAGGPSDEDLHREKTVLEAKLQELESYQPQNTA